jgi:hypothetical protein
VTGTATVSGGQRSGVSQVVIDPSFQDVGASLTDYDAALLVLSTQTTQPAVTLASPADSALYGAGTSVSVVGWGQTSGTATSYSTTLQAGQLAILSQSTCQKDSQSSFGAKLDTNDQICALSSTGTEGICFVEIGLTIWNTGNCVTNQPDYFTSISGVSSWLSTEISALATALQPTSGTSGSSSSASNQSTSKPRVGEYAGKTGQARSVNIMVAKSQTEVSTATVTVQLRCTRLKHLLTYTIAPRGGSYWPRRITQNKGRGFKDTLTFHGWRVVLGTYFWTNGKAKGSVTVAGSNKADGSCRTGTVRWTAKIS